MRAKSIYAIVSGVLLTFVLLASDAHAQCPSNGYFRADASNQLPQFGTSLDSTVCLSIATRTTQINANAVVIAQIADARKIQAALIARLVSGAGCGYASVQGWDFTDLNVSFSGVGSSARVRVNLVAKDCQYYPLRGLRLTYDAPLGVSVSGDTVTMSVNIQKSRLFSTSSGNNLPFGLSDVAKNAIGEKLAAALATPLDVSSYIPSYARALNPSVTQVAFTLQSNRLMLKIYIAGEVKKKDADQLLSTTVATQVIPPFMRWVNQGAPAF